MNSLPSPGPDGSARDQGRRPLRERLAGGDRSGFAANLPAAPPQGPPDIGVASPHDLSSDGSASLEIGSGESGVRVQAARLEHCAQQGSDDSIVAAQAMLTELSHLRAAHSPELLREVSSLLLESARLELCSARYERAAKLAEICALFCETHGPQELRDTHWKAMAFHLDVLMMRGGPREHAERIGREFENRDAEFERLSPITRMSVSIAQAAWFFKRREPFLMVQSDEIAPLQRVRDRLASSIAELANQPADFPDRPELSFWLSLHFGTCLLALGGPGASRVALEELQRVSTMGIRSGVVNKDPYAKGVLKERLSDAMGLGERSPHQSREQDYEGAATSFATRAEIRDAHVVRASFRHCVSVRLAGDWHRADLLLGKFLEQHRGGLEACPLDAAEVYLEAALVKSALGETVSGRSYAGRSLAIIESCLRVLKYGGVGNNGPLYSRMYPFSVCQRERFSEVVSRCVDFFLDHDRPQLVRDIARLHCELFGGGEDRGPAVRAIQDRGLVESALTLSRDSGRGSARSEVGNGAVSQWESTVPQPPLSLHGLREIKDRLEFSGAQIEGLAECDQLAAKIRQRRVHAQLVLSLGDRSEFVMNAHELLSAKQRYLRDDRAGPAFRLEFARGELLAARELVRLNSGQDGESQDSESQDSESQDSESQDSELIMQDAHRLFMGAERELTQYAGRLSYPTYLALNGFMATLDAAMASLPAYQPQRRRLIELRAIYGAL